MHVANFAKIAVFALALLLLEMAAPAAPAYAQGVAVNNIQIVGLKNLDQSIVLNALTIKPGQEISGNVLTELNRNSELLYATGYFQEPPQLSLDYLEGMTILVIEVLENPVFREVQFTGNTIYSDEELQEHITLTPGEVTNLRRLEDDIAVGVLGKYSEDGYVGAYIVEFALSTLEEDTGTVYVTIGEGVVDDIVFEGNEKTKESLLRMVVGRQVKTGELLAKDGVEKAMQDLYNMGIFEQVEPTMEPSVTPGNLILKFAVTEQFVCCIQNVL